MKKSHRKDVILARIIFAAICLLLIAAIAGAVMLIKDRFASDAPETESSQESESSEEIPGFDYVPIEPETGAGTETETEEEKRMMQTSTGLNLRTEPNADCEVITVLRAGTRLEILSEEDGWAMVEYQGRTGYVSMEYLEEVTEE